jgi:hypothetical protein
MFLQRLLSRTFALLLPFAVTATVYLYFYPVFKGCAFPLPQSHSQTGLQSWKPHHNAFINTLFQHLRIAPNPAADTQSQAAIFRLLVLADPQLEGDTSLPFPEYELYPRIQTHWRTIQEALGNSSTPSSSLLNDTVLSTITTALQALLKEDIPRAINAALKRLDLFGNDFYLAHIYRTLSWWTKPTHTTVLGDLVGSQWISDEEFAKRSHRYWDRVFRGSERVSDNITRTGAKTQHTTDKSPPVELLGKNADPRWATRLINVAGNHDIGYAGDISAARMERFEREFGRANWDVRFEYPDAYSRNESGSGSEGVVPSLHMINLNTLVFDTPALSGEVQGDSYSYLNELISERLSAVEDRSVFTLLLTHLPLHKKEGVCVDGPFFSFWDSDDEDGPGGVARWLEGGLKEQNHLSDFISGGGVLQGIFGLSGDENAVSGGRGRNGLILTGHDHTGCDAVHYVNRTESVHGEEEERVDDESPAKNWHWAAKRFDGSRIDDPSIREVTLRSMMGEFGGNAGLLSAWFDDAAGQWDYEITMCPAGVQHIWWAIHVLVLVTAGVALLRFAVALTGSGHGTKQVVSPDSSKIQQEKTQRVQEK